MPQNKRKNIETPALPTKEELRHLYGDTVSYVDSLAAKAKRSAERAGASEKAKRVVEDSKTIIDNLNCALEADVKNVESGRKPYTHNDLEKIVKKQYTHFSDLAADFFDEEPEEKDISEPEKKARKYYLIDGSAIPADDSALPALLAAINSGKGVQLITISDEGVPSFTVIAEPKPRKKKSEPAPTVNDEDEPDDDESDNDESDDDESTKVPVKKMTIIFNDEETEALVATHGKKNKTRYVLGLEDGTKVFASMVDAKKTRKNPVWLELEIDSNSTEISADGRSYSMYRIKPSGKKVKFRKG